MTDTDKPTVPTWGWDADGNGKIFNLPEGEGLPEGWSDSPAPEPTHATDNGDFVPSAFVEDEDEGDEEDFTDAELEEMTAPDEADD